MTAAAPAIPRAVIRLAVPAIATGLLGTAVFLADRLMLARHDQAALASMQLQGPLLWSVTSVFMALCTGTVAVVARSTGAGDGARARAAARASVRLSALLGTVVAVVGLLLLQPLVSAFGPDEPALRALSADYLRITLATLPFTFVATSAAMVFSAHGDTRTPLLAGAFANLVNIAINGLLIYGHSLRLGPLALDVPAMGVEGAATGTASAFVLEALALLWALGRPHHPLCIAGWWRAPQPADREARAAILRVSVPAVLERALVHAGFLSYAKAIAALGAVAMAANQALVTVESICFMCADGFGVAAATVMGQRLGAGDAAGARAGGRFSCALAVGSITLAGLLVWATGALTLPVFVAPGQDGTALVETALVALPLLALAQPGMSAGIVLAMGLRGAGDTRTPLVAAVLGGLLVRVPLAWGLALGLGWGLRGIWIASTIDWSVRALWLGFAFARGRWTKTAV